MEQTLKNKVQMKRTRGGDPLGELGSESGSLTAVAEERRDNKNRARPWKGPVPLSPKRMALLMGLAVFFCEAFAMLLIAQLPELSGVTEVLVDSSILLVLLTPLYLFYYRPFWSEHQTFSREVSFLSRKLLRTVEEERKRVSHELHDQCGQTLTALQFGLEALRKGMTEECDEAKEQVRELTALVGQLSNEMREVTHSLRPALLEQIGLEAALRSLIAEFSRLHSEIEISESYCGEGGDRAKYDDEVELALYRICQECLNNISKHALADKVIVRLEEDDEWVVLNMGDHGCGFDPRQGGDQRKGFGLLGIRERVADLGGTFRLSTGVGKGTFITVELPRQIRDEYGNSD